MARCGKINKTTVYYALFNSVSEVTDADGNYTGEYDVSYSNPIEARMNVSVASGKATDNEFGIDTPYTRTIVTEDMDTLFDTDTVFWLDGATPSTRPHNYRVVAVARSLPKAEQRSLRSRKRR